MMSDEMLSQEEIEALLKGNIEQITSEEVTIDSLLSPMEQDTIGEIGNICFGSSATALSTLLNQKVEITTPTVSLVQTKELVNEFPTPYVAIGVNYIQGIEGANLLVISTKDASIIADLMLGGDGTNPKPELDEIKLSAVQEAMNQMMGSAATSMSSMFGKKVDITPPSTVILDIPNGEGLNALPVEERLVKVSFRLKVGQLIDSYLMQLLTPAFANEILNELLMKKESEPTVNKPEALKVQFEEPVVTPAVREPEPVRESVVSFENEEPRFMERPTEMQRPVPKVEHVNPTNVQPAAFTQFQPTTVTESESRNLNLLFDIPLSVTVELGRTKRTVKDILELSNGSIIELDKLAGEPVDILINNKLIAKGEVVVIEENFGVRITDILSQSDRIQNLR